MKKYEHVQHLTVTREPVDYRKFNWIDIASIIPEFDYKNIRLRHQEVTELRQSLAIAKALGEPSFPWIPERTKLAALYIGNKMFMSDITMERATNAHFLDRAHGHVLIAGLGIGMILPPLMSKPEVKSITIIERSEDLIACIGPFVKLMMHLTQYRKPLSILNDNMFTWKSNGEVYDTVWLDIWPHICPRYLPQMHRQMNRYYRFINRENPAPFIDCWSRDMMEGDSAEWEQADAIMELKRADIRDSEDTYAAFMRNGITHLHPMQCKNGKGNIFNERFPQEMIEKLPIDVALRYFEAFAMHSDVIHVGSINEKGG